MKKFVVATPNQAAFNAVSEWGKNNGYNTIPAGKYQRHESDSAINFGYTAGEAGYGDMPFYKKNTHTFGPIVSFEAFAAIQGIELVPKPEEIHVGDYDALVDYQDKTVKVGCQTIPFAKVKEVYDLTRKHDSQTTGDGVRQSEKDACIMNAVAYAQPGSIIPMSDRKRAVEYIKNAGYKLVKA